MEELKPKRGVQILLDLEDFHKKVEVSVNRVWDIVKSRGRHREEDVVLATNVHGTEEEVTRLAQEAFGFHPEATICDEWRLVPSKVEVMAIDAVAVLSSLGIEAKPIPNALEGERREAEKGK